MQRTAGHLFEKMKKSMNHIENFQTNTPPGTRDMMTINLDNEDWDQLASLTCENPSSSSARVLGSLECGTYEDELGASLPDVHAQATTDTRNASIAQTRTTRSGTYVVCYACKISVISKNVRRRPIDGKIREMCAFCHNNIHKVLGALENSQFGTVDVDVALRTYPHQSYKDKPLPPITIPEGWNLEDIMKGARQHSWARENDPSRSPKQLRTFGQIHGRKMTEKLERVILDTYEYHKHTKRHRRTPWKEIGEDALQRYDGFADRDKPHTSLGNTIRMFVEQRLNTVS